jgi:hypothetical protein
MREAVFSRAMGGLAKIGLEGTRGEVFSEESLGR